MIGMVPKFERQRMEETMKESAASSVNLKLVEARLCVLTVTGRWLWYRLGHTSLITLVSSPLVLVRVGNNIVMKPCSALSLFPSPFLLRSRSIMDYGH